jgi:cation:H+ antiporter
MMIQATVPTALGLFFTSWIFSRQLIISGVVTMMAVAVLLVLFSRDSVNARSLVPVGLLYGLFLAAIAFL